MSKLIKLPRRVWEKIKSKPKRVACPACSRLVLPEAIIEENGYIECKHCTP